MTRGWRLLVIDDNPGDRRLVEAELAFAGSRPVEVVGVGTLKAGIAALAGDMAFDAALLDMGLPDSLGLDTVKGFLAAAPDLPVVVFTGLDDHDMGVRAVAAGAQDYLVKGEVRGDVLERAIAHAIQRKRIEGRLRDEENRLRHILESSPVGVAISRPDGTIVFANARLGALFGAAGRSSRGPLYGRNARDLYVEPADRDRLLADVARHGEVTDREVRFHRVDAAAGGAPFWGLLTMGRTEWDGEAALLTWIYDISERKAAEEALRHSRDQAEAAARAKTAFLATVSHEIRTPLNGMIGMLQLLLDMPLGEVQRDRAETVAYSAEALMTIVDGVLDLAKLEAGRMDLSEAPFDLPRVVTSVVNLMASRAAEKGLAVAVHVDPALPVYWRGDAGRLRQVLLNLLSNALKFTEEGGVAVSVVPALPSAADAPGGSWLVRFEVADTGPGLPEAIAGHLFEAFAQGGPEVAGRYGGTGLGLAICRELVALMGGSIEVDSRPGRGSVFRFVVPLTPLADGGEAAEHPAGESSAVPRRSLRVLVAEDNEINQRVMTAMLERDGHHVSLAGDGLVAVTAVAEAAAAGRPFDVVLMDVRMPRLDGYGATRRIRALPGDAGRVPVVAVTADALGADVREALAAGLDSHLAKPVRLGALRRLLDQLPPPAVAPPPPSPPASEAAAEIPAPPIPPASPIPPIIDPSVLDGLGRELERAFLADLAAAFLVRAAEELAIIGDPGEPTLRRRQAAHDLKATAGNFGLCALSDQARQVEAALAAGAGADAIAATARPLAALLSGAVAALRAYFPELPPR